jgi:MOSC domain-containing protein YiiM
MSAKVIWIGVRPERKAPVQSRTEVYADREDGLTGDHPTQPHRQLTLISQEAMEEVARILKIEKADPAKTRRNMLIEGLDLSLSSGDQLRIGGAIIEITGPCLPCERMNETFGHGGRLAMAEAGGLTARILLSGTIRVGDEVRVVKAVARAPVSFRR